MIKYVSILVDVCVSACAEAPSGDAHENEGQDHHENTGKQDTTSPTKLCTLQRHKLFSTIDIARKV